MSFYHGATDLNIRATASGYAEKKQGIVPECRFLEDFLNGRIGHACDFRGLADTFIAPISEVKSLQCGDSPIASAAEPWVFPDMTLLLSDIIEPLEVAIGTRVYSYQFHMLLLLCEQPKMTAGELRARCRVSSTTCSNTLSGLEARGLVHSQQGETDRRRRYYALSDHARQVLNAKDDFRAQWLDEQQEQAPIDEATLLGAIQGFEQQLNIRMFASEYHLLINLYDSGQLSGNDLCMIATTSPSKFYQDIARLKRDGLILTSRDGADDRRIIYRLADHIRQDMDKAHARVAAIGGPTVMH